MTMHNSNLNINSPDLNIMLKACMRASKKISRDYGEIANLQISIKGTKDFVTNVDRAVEKEIVNILSYARPDHGFLMEEGGVKQGNNTYRWIIDPIDGTRNFINAINYFAISIALEQEGKIIAGVVYNPITQELFYAEKGKGAYLNNKKLRVGNKNKIEHTLLGLALPKYGYQQEELFYTSFRKIIRDTSGVRKMGSASLDLCYVAGGLLDGYYAVDLKYWDIAASIIIIQEAGGIISEIGNKTNFDIDCNCIAGNSFIHNYLQEMIQQIGIK